MYGVSMMKTFFYHFRYAKIEWSSKKSYKVNIRSFSKEDNRKIIHSIYSLLHASLTLSMEIPGEQEKCIGPGITPFNIIWSVYYPYKMCQVYQA